MGKKPDKSSYAMPKKAVILSSSRSVSRSTIDQGLQEAAPLALGYLINLVRDNEASHRQRLEAAKTLLDRAGYSARSVAEEGVKNLQELSTVELTDMLAEIHALKSQRAVKTIDAEEPDCSLLD